MEGLLLEAAKGAEESAADSLRQILPLRTAGSKAPLFAVHPASGISWGYASMLGRLDPERPLIGLQMPGMEPGRTHPVEATTPDRAGGRLHRPDPFRAAVRARTT